MMGRVSRLRFARGRQIFALGAGLLWLAVASASGYAQTVPHDKDIPEVAIEITDRLTSAADALSSAPEYRVPDVKQTSVSITELPAPFTFDEKTMMRAGDIRPGMKAYGLSVFSGLEPERFDADIIGVRHRMMAGTDIILCRIKSPYLVELGVIAGMSGSPVYVDGKLIGAVAYGFLDVDDPLAGITPIEDMLRVYNSTPSVGAVGPAAGEVRGGTEAYQAYMQLKNEPSMENLKRVPSPGSVGGTIRVTRAELGAEVGDQYNLPSEFTLEPLSSPVLLNASRPETEKLAATLFSGTDVVPTGKSMHAASTWAPSALAENSPGGQLTDLSAFSDKISGGYALSVPYVEGDLNMAVVGTVTWREGNRLVAFGHPMAQRGSVYAPMAAARINALIRSRVKPFKLGEPVGHVGMIRQDRLPAVGGLFGQTARMIPFSTHITDKNYGGTRDFRFRVWEDRDMTPALIMTSIVDSMGAAAREGGDSAALYKYSIGLDDGTTVTAENYSSDTGGTLYTSMEAMADVGILLNNPFKNVGINDMSFAIEVTDRLRLADIETAVLDKGVYEPGENVTLEWQLRPYREEPVRMKYNFKVPEGLPDGNYELYVGDAANRQDLENRRNPGGDTIRNYDDLLRVLRQNWSANRAYISMVDKDSGVNVSGSEMPRLPASVLGVIQDTVNADFVDAVKGNFVVDADVKTDYEVKGKARATLRVKRNQAN